MKHSECQRVKRTKRDYFFAFKIMDVSEIERGQLTYKQAQKKYAI